MENQEQLYVKGFNAGYLLSQHEPELLQQFLKSTDTNKIYMQGLSMGQKQYEKEKLLEQMKKSQSKERGLEM